MDDLLTRNWIFTALRGVIAIAFGILTLFNPVLTLAVLIFAFGTYSLVDGAFAAGTAIAKRRSEPYWVSMLIGGIAGIIVGVITFFMPDITAIFLLYMIAIWAIITGIFQLITAVRLRKVITGEWLLAFAGIITVIFGILLLIAPSAGALAVTLWIGIYATIFGVVLLALAFRLRRWHKMASNSRIASTV